MLIIATIGINSITEDKIRKIILAGADIIRYNFSHRVMSENLEYVEMGEKIIDELNATTKILIDLPSNKIRLGYFDNITYSVVENQELILKSAKYSPDCNEFLPIETEKIGLKVHENQTVTIGDGEIALQIIKIIDDDTIKVRMLNNGIIKIMKTFNAGIYFNDDIHISHCEDILKKISKTKPDYIAISYINKEINEKIKNLIKEEEKNYKIIAKIEKEMTEEEIKEVLDDSDYKMIIIDLGEMGVNMPFEKFGIFYQKIMRLAKKSKKTILAMTQLLESTTNYYIPNRSEILNLTNMVNDGVGGIILCHETGIGKRPSYAINVAKKIINDIEKEKYVK